jgi:hypothetical protein
LNTPANENERLQRCWKLRMRIQPVTRASPWSTRCPVDVISWADSG